ncbi:hypothetical protein [Aliivibrio fischeri]|uniref:hypothetical protein n=1 Tax=Aliivibrio fischeri TaxID=668 RepID=UPI0014330A17|nr:hypothetical protein [Aliivibrio fischeri]
MDSFFSSEIILAHSTFFFFMTFLLTGLLHVPLWCGKNLTKIQWKKVDYLWPLVAAIGLMGTVSEVRSRVATDWAETEHTRAVTSLESINSYTVNQLKSYLCSGATGVEDDLVSKQSCSWFLDSAKYLESVRFNDLPNIGFESLPPITFSQSIIESDVIWLRGMFDNYKAQKQVYETTLQETKKHPLEEIFWYLSPYLICIAISVRVTKVSAELKLEKQQCNL